jgi:hypothetical protein
MPLEETFLYQYSSAVMHNLYCYNVYFILKQQFIYLFLSASTDCKHFTMLNSIRSVTLFFFIIPFYLQSVLVHSANCVKRHIQWHVEECSVVLL